MNFFLIRFRISSYLNILSHFQMLPHIFYVFQQINAYSKYFYLYGILFMETR